MFSPVIVNIGKIGIIIIILPSIVVYHICLNCLIFLQNTVSLIKFAITPTSWHEFSQNPGCSALF